MLLCMKTTKQSEVIQPTHWLPSLIFWWLSSSVIICTPCLLTLLIFLPFSGGAPPIISDWFKFWPLRCLLVKEQRMILFPFCFWVMHHGLKRFKPFSGYLFIASAMPHTKSSPWVVMDGILFCLKTGISYWQYDNAVIISFKITCTEYDLWVIIIIQQSREGLKWCYSQPGGLLLCLGQWSIVVSIFLRKRPICRRKQ